MTMSDVPERLGESYRVLRLLSKGGMASVYEGRRQGAAGVSAKVAIKLIDPKKASDPKFQQLFIQEAKVSSNLRHQNLIQIQDFDQQDELLFLVMEYVEGVTLRSAIKRSRKHGVPISIELVAEIGRQICDGLAHAHQAQDPSGMSLGVVHRDIKPSNLMINGQGVVKLLDFGVSQATINNERKGVVLGTMGYMSPEQARGDEVTPMTDLFSLGVVLYELASQKNMFSTEERKDRRRFVELLLEDAAVERVSAMDPSLSKLKPILIRALQRDPKARYQSAHQMGQDLAELVEELVQARQMLIRFTKEIERLADLTERDLPPMLQDLSEYSESVLLPGRMRKNSSKSGEAKRSSDVDYRKKTWGIVVTLIAPLILAFLILGLYQTFKSLQDSPSNTEDIKLAQDDQLSKDKRTDVDQTSGQAGTQSVTVVQSTQGSGFKKSSTKPNTQRKKKQKKLTPQESKKVSKSSKGSESEENLNNDSEIKSEQQNNVAEFEKGGTGYLTVSADTSARVFIDGVPVATGLLSKEAISAGRHQIHIAHPDGRVKKFVVHVRPNEESIYIWSFYSSSWLKKEP